VEDDKLTPDFPGKGKRRITASLTDTKVARNIEAARKTKGRRLFKLRSGKGYRNMTANDLNAYLAEIANCDISAKDFRALRASALAITSLSAAGEGKTSARRRAWAKACRRDQRRALQHAGSRAQELCACADRDGVCRGHALVHGSMNDTQGMHAQRVLAAGFPARARMTERLTLFECLHVSAHFTITPAACRSRRGFVRF